METCKNKKLRDQSDLDWLVTRLLVDVTAQHDLSNCQVLKITGVDLNKYKEGGSIPTLNSCYRVSEYLGVPPGITSLHGSWVHNNIIPYQQACDILAHWPEYDHLLTGLQYSIIQLAKKH